MPKKHVLNLDKFIASNWKIGHNRTLIAECNVIDYRVKTFKKRWRKIAHQRLSVLGSCSSQCIFHLWEFQAATHINTHNTQPCNKIVLPRAESQVAPNSIFTFQKTLATRDPPQLKIPPITQSSLLPALDAPATTGGTQDKVYTRAARGDKYIREAGAGGRKSARARLTRAGGLAPIITGRWTEFIFAPPATLINNPLSGPLLPALAFLPSLLCSVLVNTRRRKIARYKSVSGEGNSSGARVSFFCCSLWGRGFWCARAF